MLDGLRILHVLSPVKWDGATFIADADSNWKVAEKTINFLPNCHHYILVPPKHTISLNQPNITFIPYDYPKSVQLNRGIFDYRNVKFDFTRNDIDFVFTHQPEVAFNIQQWLHTNRYYEDVAYFGFYHWIDCNKSRGSKTGCPSFYMRQLEAMHVVDANFIHSELSMDYLKSNFGELDVTKLIQKTFHMPLSSKIDIEPEDFELPNKKILLFNHRWNKSSGIDKLVEYSETLSDEYIIWVTDDRCDVKNNKFHVERLNYAKYAFLVMNCHASLCFIDGYSTWNLSAQDSLLFNRPLLYLDHPTVKKVIGEEYKGSFKTIEEFNSLLRTIKNSNGKFLV